MEKLKTYTENGVVKVSEVPNSQVGGPKEVYACGECGVSWPGNVQVHSIGLVVWFVYLPLVDFYGVNGGKYIKIY